MWDFSKGIRVGNPNFIARDDWEVAHRNVLVNTSAVQPYISEYIMTFYFHRDMTCYS